MKIIRKEILVADKNSRINKLVIKAPEIAKKAQPGQFVVIMVNEKGERIPLTIVDKNEEKGLITLIFQEVGFSTKLLGRKHVNDSLYALVGPLGQPTEIKNYGKVIIVGGGVGLAEIYPVVRALRKEGNRVTTIIGARTKAMLILEKELKAISDECYITTDDGSYMRKGFTTDILTELLKKAKYDMVYAVGPVAMMQKVSSITKDYGVKTIVSLNALMIDATGMCGCCRVNVGGQTKFSCIDGPEFDAHLVDWSELAKRNAIYSAQEKHICNLINKL